MSICYTKANDHVRSQRFQSVNSTACAQQPELSQHTLLFLTWKRNTNHRNSIHFRELWWYQLEEI